MKKVVLAAASLLLMFTLAGCGHQYLGKKDVTYVYKTTFKRHGKSTIRTNLTGKFGKNGTSAYTFHKDGTFDSVYMGTNKYYVGDSISMFGFFQHGTYKLSGKTAQMKPTFYVHVEYNSDLDEEPTISQKHAKSYPIYFDSNDNQILHTSKAMKEDNKKVHTTEVNKPIKPTTSHTISKKYMANQCRKYLELVKDYYEVYGE